MYDDHWWSFFSKDAIISDVFVGAFHPIFHVQAQWIHPSVKVDILLPLWSPYFDNQRVITTVILTREHSHSECRLDWHPLLGCWKKGKPHPHGSKWWHLLQCDILICNALPLSLMMFIYTYICLKARIWSFNHNFPIFCRCHFLGIPLPRHPNPWNPNLFRGQSDFVSVNQYRCL